MANPGVMIWPYSAPLLSCDVCIGVRRELFCFTPFDLPRSEDVHALSFL